MEDKERVSWAFVDFYEGFAFFLSALGLFLKELLRIGRHRESLLFHYSYMRQGRRMDVLNRYPVVHIGERWWLLSATSLLLTPSTIHPGNGVYWIVLDNNTE